MIMRKKALIFFIVIFLTIPIFSFGQTPLEVDYPLTPGGEAPTTVEATTLALYIKYIYNISFGIAAVIAFIAIVYAGFLYLSSVGDPNKIKEAKSRIFSALLGIGILLISYVLLIAINPETIMLITPGLEKIPSSPYVTSLKDLRSQTLGTVKEIGVMGKLAMEGIEEVGDNIFESSLICNCVFARGLCLCTGGSETSSCQPQTCYASEDNDGHPCSNYNEIIEWEELLSFWMDELIYYQNRAVGTDLLEAARLEEAEEEIIASVIEKLMAGDFDDILDDAVDAALAGYLGGEAKSLQKDIVNIARPTIAYYEDYIRALPPAPETDPRTIETLNQILDREEEKLELKQDLLGELIKFNFLVEAIKIPVNQVADLTEQCALNTQSQCSPQCYGECHDTYIGCQAVCIGLNPCPIIDITIAWGEFELLQGEIENTTEEIIKLVDEIRQLEL